MLVQDIINLLEELAPTAYAEDFDNVGLLVGSKSDDVNGILVTLDTLEEVVDEAVSKKCNLIVSFHPILFNGLKKITGSTYVERTILKSIQNNIAIYAIHTALDNSYNGVNAKICDVLGLKNRKMLIPQKSTIKKLITFVPVKNAQELRDALFNAGAGSIGNYDHCSFNIEGTGTFRGNEQANPVVGKKGVTSFEKEMQIGVTYPKHLEKNVLNALFSNHPYEEVAYEITTLENTNQHIGMGMIGEFDVAMQETEFLKKVKDSFGCGIIKHSRQLGKPIKKVAVLGGSGAFAIEAAKVAGADAFITSDIKYHQFFSAEGKLLLLDIGHYESEQFTKKLLVEHLTKKIANFAPAFPAGKVILSNCNTNPVKYF